MRKSWLIVAFLLLALPGFGQRDTVLAVHHLFAQKRGNGQAWAGTGAEMAVDEGVGRRAQ